MWPEAFPSLSVRAFLQLRLTAVFPEEEKRDVSDDARPRYNRDTTGWEQRGLCSSLLPATKQMRTILVSERFNSLTRRKYAKPPIPV